MKRLVFFPTYNEAGNVAAIIGRIARAVPDANILVVDDCSRDGTTELLESLQQDHLKVLVRPKKLGVGSAHLLAWCHALHHGYDTLVTMDADHSHDPAELPVLLARLDSGFDLVVGSRYMPGGSCDYTGYRRWVSRTANFGAHLLLRIGISEFTNSFRAFRVAKLRQMDFANLSAGGYSFFFMAIQEANRCGLRIADVPIHFHNRNAGVSKIPNLEVLRGMRNLIASATAGYNSRSADVRGEISACSTCGCEYSRIVQRNVARSGRLGATPRTTEFCVFCGDEGVARQGSLQPQARKPAASAIGQDDNKTEQH